MNSYQRFRAIKNLKQGEKASIAGFHNTFGSTANFEQIKNIQLPADIAELLTPPQTE